MRYDFKEAQLPESFFWFNEPHAYRLENGLTVVTKPETDFWQRTHYGFQRDDGHCLLTAVSGDFAMTTQTQFQPQSQYDQCGLIARIDAENWIKCSVEYEDERLSRLGSVVTNYGYSDWATQDISSEVRSLFYRLSRRGQDIRIEYALDGTEWHQTRIAHLHKDARSLDVGIYACSPIGEAFECTFCFLEIGETDWHYSQD